MNTVSGTLRGAAIRFLLRASSLLTLLALLLLLPPASAQDTASAASHPTLEGSVTDPSGAVIQGARVTVTIAGSTAAEAETDAQGRFSAELPSAGRYLVTIGAASFRTLSIPVEAPEHGVRRLRISLELNPLSETVTVTATGVPTLKKNSGSAVSVLTAKEFSHTVGVEAPLRLIPGAEVVQSGQAGSATALFLRGGNANANKVLIDGVALNDVGGGIDFAAVASTGVEKIEVLRGPNSAIYGADALAGVVSMNTPRGTTPLPRLDYLVEGGNFSSYRQDGTLSGLYRSFDYFADYSRFDTANAIPRSQYHLGALNSSFGWTISPATELRANVHHFRVAAGHPNAVLLYGIPDNTKQANENALGGIRLDHEISPRWHGSASYSLLRLRMLSTDFSPTGIPQYDGDGNVMGYLGAPVTIHGANGYTVSGQAQYQYVMPYPSEFATSTDRDVVAAQSDYRFHPHLTGLVGFQYQKERGYSGSPASGLDRGVYDLTFQTAGEVFGRLRFTLGSGIERNELFGWAATPRLALAYDLFSWAGGRTKLRASAGKGIKEPSLVDQGSSLYSLLSGLPGGDDLISEYHVPVIGPEESRALDAGVDQTFFGDRERLSFSYFHSRYSNGIEYVAQQGLLALGVPEPVVAQAMFGATVNSQVFRAQGIELDGEASLGPHWFARAGYTCLDAVIERSFSSDALGPYYNPNFPSIPIGAFSPLEGARPFRRAPHSGYFSAIYTRPRFTARLTGSLVGRRDDTDFLSADANYQPTMLLPNRNLDPAYQRLDLTLIYSPASRLTTFTSMQNLLSQHTMEAFGYPSLPFTFRGGIRLSFGGESWKWR